MKLHSRISLTLSLIGAALLAFVIAALIYSDGLAPLVQLAITGVTMLNIAVVIYLLFRGRPTPEPEGELGRKGRWTSVNYTTVYNGESELHLVLSGAEANLVANHIRKADREGRRW